MNEISIKEKSFKNKIAPVTETVGEKKLEVMYWGIDIKNTSTSSKEITITSKHIRALNTFLLMFSGCGIRQLTIQNSKITRNSRELLRINEILRTAPPVIVPIEVGRLEFFSTEKAKTVHPALLQIVIRAIGDTGTKQEASIFITIPIATNHIQKAIMLLGSLRQKRVERLDIEIKAKEFPAVGTTEMGLNSTQTPQEWKYEVQSLAIRLQDNNIRFNLPAWLFKKPTSILKLCPQHYARLCKEEIESIRAPIFSFSVQGEIAQYRIDTDELMKKRKEVTNTKIKELQIINDRITHEKDNTKEVTLEYIRRALTWATTQFPSLIKLYMDGFIWSGNIDPSLSQAIYKMAKELTPRMPRLSIIEIDEIVVIFS